MSNRRMARECDHFKTILLKSFFGTGVPIADVVGRIGVVQRQHRRSMPHRRKQCARLPAYAKNWTVARMSAVDRSILRMATYEMVFSPERTPVPAIIDEAIELAKKYSTENSSKFINGLLDQLKNERK